MTVGSLLRKPSGADKTNPNNPKLQGTKKMKQIVSFKMISVAALLALTIGCASTSTSTQNRENMLVASGFKMITPKTTAQQQKLQNLPPGKVTMIQKGGKTYYVFPDRLTTAPMSVDPGSTRLTNSSALQINSWPRILKPPRCTRMRRCSGAYGAGGTRALDHSDQWQGRSRIKASWAGPHPLLAGAS